MEAAEKVALNKLKLSARQVLFCFVLAQGTRQMAPHDRHNNVQQGLWFSIEIEKEEIVIFISMDALTDRFNASPKKCDQLAAYKKNKEIIDAVAHRKFHEGVVRPIKLSVADF